MDLEFGVFFKNWLTDLGLNDRYSIFVKDTLFFLAVIILSIIVDLVVKRIIVRIINRLVAKSKTTWDNALVERKVFNRFSHIAAAIVVFMLAPVVLKDYEFFTWLIIVMTKIYMVVIVLLVINSFLNAFHDIYLSYEASKLKPIKGYIQVVKIIVYIIGAIIILSIILNKTPVYFIGGLGALTAILILIFKDPILGFVGSIQLSANDMLRPGDWITMNKYEADGTVLEINLTTVKVQNFDKSVTTIPTYSFISDSFHNWRAVEEAGLRRIKRSINIDINSIRFCNEVMLNNLMQCDMFKKFLSGDTFSNLTKEKSDKNNLTNLGLFKIYLQAYLKQIPDIKTDYLFMVRQLQPTEKGLPLEVYLFAAYKNLNQFEDLQFGIFEHIIAVAEKFELRFFQNSNYS